MTAKKSPTKKTKSSEAQEETQKTTGMKKKKSSFLSNKYAIPVALFAVIAGIVTYVALANERVTATPGGVFISMTEINKLPQSGPAWENLKKVADQPLGAADIADQTSNHDIATYANALVYAKTGDETYRTKAANAVMSAIGSEDGGRTLALAWNLSAYVISADLINLPQYDAAKAAQFKTWLTGVRNETLDGKSLISTHEIRPNNWGTSAGASRIAADIYLGDKTDLDKAAKVFKGYLGDRATYSGFSYGELSWQCDPANPVGINPAGCKREGIDVGGAIPDDMRRGDTLRYPPAATDYPWTALQGVAMQAELLARQGYDAYGWQNQAVKRSIEYLYGLSKAAGSSWWADTDEAWVPWIINSRYGTKYPTSATPAYGRVSNFSDWTHATAVTQTTPDTTAPSTPTNFKVVSSVEKNVQLSWAPSTDNIAVANYQVTRNGAALGSTANTAYTDTTAAAGQTYTYTVKATDAAGNTSGTATVSAVVAASQGDKTPPVTVLTSPAANTTITAESVPVAFTITDASAISKIELYVDSQVESVVTATAGKTSYTTSWNSKAAGNGAHKLQVKATDVAGNVGQSSEITVTVKLAVVVPPTGDILSIVANADARISEDNTGKNYGTEKLLRIRDDSKDWRTYLKFEVTGLTAKPKQVRIRLFATDGGPDAGTVYSTSTSWNEKTITWKNAPAFAAQIAKSITGSANDQSWVYYDVTSKVTGNGTYSFGLKNNDDNSIYFDSREGKKQPTLVIVK